MFDDEVKEIYDKLKLFDKMYEIIRFVDPISKKVVTYKNKAISEMNISCFDFWGKNKVCDNCISMRSYNDNETYIKIEYAGDKVYMVTAVPVELSNRRIVIELMKDATNSIIFGTDENNDAARSKIYAMIDGMNNKALKDSLTGVYNRRYINEKLPLDLVNANLSNQNLSIIMTDIDHFKIVNDTYGHLTGDCVLINFTKILSDCIQRDSDWLARFGGEEFLICLPGSDLDMAVKTAEKMRKAVEDATMKCKNSSIRVTASFGIFSLKTDKKDNIDDMIELADKKLYLAKNNGRNRVEF